MCRICGSQTKTQDCCPNPLDGGKNWVDRDTFKKKLAEVWQVPIDQISYSVVKDFYDDWINGTDIPVEQYLKECGE